MNCAIEIRNLSHLYSPGTPSQVTALKDINLRIGHGEILGIIGHTGSGKSTLISHFNGLLKPSSGTVLVDGEDIHKDKETLRASRFKVGLCFQYPEYQLFEETVFKDIAFGPKNMKLSDGEIKQRVLRAAQYTGVPEEMLEKSPFDLSGGEKRRVAIAGVMAMEPQVLVFDEPAAGLDPSGRKALINLIKDYHKKTGCTVIVVSHSMEDIARLADRLIVINGGTIAMDGSLHDVFSRSEELAGMGLDVPEVTKIFAQIRARGFDVPLDVYSVEYAEKTILSMLEGGNVQ
ncbi:MAG: energy-coupling factor transporter ATPase [Clostridia bacterium]|nr:energy-coupling factor transporter ATPase [Clostridia bacterium]